MDYLARLNWEERQAFADMASANVHYTQMVAIDGPLVPGAVSAKARRDRAITHWQAAVDTLDMAIEQFINEEVPA